MKRAILPLGLLAVVFATGCASSHSPAAIAQAPVRTAAAQVPMVFESIDDDAYGPAATAAATAAPGRNPGDFVVTEIASAGRKTPLVLTQRVLARDGGSITVEVSLADGKKTDTFRVHFDGDQIAEVTKVLAGVEHASTAAAYESLMAKTVPAVDRNDGVVDSEPVSVSVAGKTVAATRTSYKVSLAGKEATMTVTQSDRFAWGDVEGEISDNAGKMVYRARVLETSASGEKGSVAILAR